MPGILPLRLRAQWRLGPRPGCGARGSKADDQEWPLVTKVRRLGKALKITYLEIYLFSLLIKESEIIDFFLGPAFKAEVLKIMPV